MKKTLVLLFGLCLILVACSPTPQAAPPVETQPVSNVPETTQAIQEPEIVASDPAASQPEVAEVQPTAPVVDTQGQGLPLVSIRDTLFNGSGNCAVCHTQMTDMTGQDVSTDRLWRATMMANAARDPYWQASVRREVLSNPQFKDVIEDKCSTCHMPMARFTDLSQGSQGLMLDQGYLDPAHARHQLAIDGVSCTLCHQVQEDNFDTMESFSGGYAIDEDTPTGERLIYGIYGSRPGQSRIMQGVSGFVPVLGLHIEESALCGTCHNLYTPYLDESDQVAGEFPEQMVYSEWLNSAYVDQQSCQGCHMPEAQGGVQISNTGGPRQSPFFQHFFVGGNLYIPKVFQAHGDEMSVTASNEQFATTIENVEAKLTTETATLAIENATLQDGKLGFEVILESQVGHKFPAGFPSRRAWLHVTVLDASGAVVFESGGSDETGAILENDNDQDPMKYEPHYSVIETSEQVQIYEAIMADTKGEMTTVLLRGSGYIKDNRILPLGFEKTAVMEDIAVKGAAVDDVDFLAGGDRVQYLVDLASTSGPFTIQVELLYQTIGYRWAINLQGYNSLETERFVNYYNEMPNLPFLVVSVESTIE